MTPRPPRARPRAVLSALACALTAGALLVGCGPKSVTPPEANPATLVPVPGSTATGSDGGDGAVRKVVLTPLAEQRLRIRTVPVAAGPAGVGEVPLTAVIYDPNGVPWVYAPAGPHAYLRQTIAIQRYDGDTVFLAKGPAVGTQVVVVAAAELLGTEYGVGEE